jgi:hypothetical protein
MVVGVLRITSGGSSGREVSVEELEHLLAKMLAAMPAAETIDDFVAHAAGRREVESLQHTEEVMQKDVGTFLRGKLTDPGHRVVKQFAFGVRTHPGSMGDRVFSSSEGYA